MVFISSSRLVLGLFLAFATLRRDSIALAALTHQEVETMVHRNGFVAFDAEPAFVNQGRSIDAVAMGLSKTWPRGRKMVIKEKMIKEEDVKRDASKITSTGKGNHNHALGKSCGRPRTNVHEIRRKMLKSEYLNHVDQMRTIDGIHGPMDEGDTQLSEASLSHGRFVSSSNSKAPFSQESLDDTTKTAESKKLYEASMDAMNMLSMDYVHPPRRKPPINNGQPLSGKTPKP